MSLGVPTFKIFPFCYFVASKQDVVASNKSYASSRPLRCAFVGSLTQLKGLPLLLDVFQELSSSCASLDLYSFDSYTLQPLPQAVHFKGPIKFGQTSLILANYDLLVLPSYYDGWGVVINEAMHAGVPVLCSTSVGASTIIKKYGSGFLFDNNSPRALLSLILSLSASRHQLLNISQNCHRASKSLAPSLGAQYIEAVLSGDSTMASRISSLWY